MPEPYPEEVQNEQDHDAYMAAGPPQPHPEPGPTPPALRPFP